MRIDSLHRRIMMDARVLHDRLTHVFPATLPKQYEKRRINVRALIKRIDAVTLEFNIKNSIGYFKPETKTDTRIFFTGEWLPECELPCEDSLADIRIGWQVSEIGKMMEFTAVSWRRLHFYYWTFVMHEMIHRHQDIQRGPDGPRTRVYRPMASDAESIAEQKYLGDYDEIEAHSHDIALELLSWFPSLHYRDAVRELRAKYDDPSISTYAIYARCFQNAETHPALGVLEQKIRQWHTSMTSNLNFYRTLELYTDGTPLIP